MPSLHITTPVGVNPAVPQNVRKAKITPLPLSQMIPMTFIIVNESLCSTMLMPFVGPFVAFLQSVSVNEAGNYSGVLIGMFMLGQVISAKTWGRISDKYGRRFPIISGLFTSGLMMLGFGLSTNVWMCAVFRFFQGLFNGNVLVAKTMMADITDKTNQAGGFSFMSLCSAFGFLIGPGLGGLLYDPANSEGLAWAHFDKHGFFATHPAFLPSLVVFVYTNIGMVVCTFLVKESNPKAQPLPPFVRLVYPCMWYRAKPFVLPPIQYEDDEVEEMLSDPAESDSVLDVRVADTTEVSSRDSADGSGVTHNREARGCRTGTTFSPTWEVTLAARNTTALPSSTAFLCEKNVTESSGVGESQETSVVPAMYAGAAIPQKTLTLYNKLSFTSPAKALEEDVDDGDDQMNVRVGMLGLRRNDMVGHVEATSTTSARPIKVVHDDKNVDFTQRRTAGPNDRSSSSSSAEAGETEEVVTVFGYREAFTLPHTRFMLSQYMVLSATDMIARDCFPLWAVAFTSMGGLGLSPSQVSYILLANSAPCLTANLLFRVVERYFSNKMGLMRVGVVGAGTVVMLLPFNSYLGSSFWVYILVFLCTAGRQVFCSWCYSLNTMLTARSAPPGHVGSIMGINQSCGALVRGIVPFFAAPLFAWSISSPHVFPFNHALVFFISSLMFFFCWWRSYSIRTNAEGHLQMVE